MLVLEREPSPATQSTARSASTWIAGYGGPVVRPFTLASRPWFEADGGGFAERSLLRPRGMLLVSPDPASPEIRAAVATDCELLGEAEARLRFPALRDGVVSTAAFDAATQDLDAAGAVRAFRTALESRHGELVLDARLTSIEPDGSGWRLRTPQRTFRTELVVDAAGAWADDVARLAGVTPLGLAAYRRTTCTFAAPTAGDVTAWPLLMDAAETYYLKPAPSGGFIASPADETRQPAGDARPGSSDVSLALRRIDAVTTLAPSSATSVSAGLRTFAPDRAPVLGPEPGVPGFVWSAALGGFGIMTAPAVARSVVSLIECGELPADVVAAGGHAASVLPDRLRTGG